MTSSSIVDLLNWINGKLNAIRKQKCFLCSPFYGRACRWAMLGELKLEGPKGSVHRSVHTFGETPAQSHFAPFIFGVILISPHPPTQFLSPPYIGGNPHTITFVFPSHLRCLTDVTSCPHTIPLTFFGIHGWRLYAPTTGYHEPQNG